MMYGRQTEPLQRVFGFACISRLLYHVLQYVLGENPSTENKRNDQIEQKEDQIKRYDLFGTVFDGEKAAERRTCQKERPGQLNHSQKAPQLTMGVEIGSQRRIKGAKNHMDKGQYGDDRNQVAVFFFHKRPPRNGQQSALPFVRE